MDRGRVNLSCNAANAEWYLEAIDGFPSDIYSDESRRFKLTINKGAAVFIPIFQEEGRYCDLNIPTKKISEVESCGDRNAVRFRRGDFLYEARTNSKEHPNDGAGELEKLTDSENKS